MNGRDEQMIADFRAEITDVAVEHIVKQLDRAKIELINLDRRQYDLLWQIAELEEQLVCEVTEAKRALAAPDPDTPGQSPTIT